MSQTVIARLEEVRKEIEERRADTVEGAAGREFSLAITALEDAAMRYTRARAIEDHKFGSADLDA